MNVDELQCVQRGNARPNSSSSCATRSTRTPGSSFNSFGRSATARPSATRTPSTARGQPPTDDIETAEQTVERSERRVG